MTYKRKETIGDATLYLGCCEEAMYDMKENQFSLAITDPPYFDGPNKLGYYGARTSGSGVTRGEFKKIGTWDVPTKEYFIFLKHVSRDQIVWGCNYYAEHLPVGRIVWDKVNGDSTFSDCELASCSFHESVRLFKYMWNGMMQGQGIVNGDIQQGNKKLNEKRIHPTQKPVALYKWILKNYAKDGDDILDTHAGSMSNVIACLDMGFKITAYEIDKDHFDAGCRRVEEHVKQLRLF